MKAAGFLLLCMAATVLLSSVLCINGIGPDNCCFKYYPGRIRKNLISSYYITDPRCPRTGVILVTLKGRHVCVKSSVPWVKDVMTNVDERSF